MLTGPSEVAEADPDIANGDELAKPAYRRTGDRAFLAFNSTVFFSGAGNVYSTLRFPGTCITLDGNRRSKDSEPRLNPNIFLSRMRQEYHPVVWAFSRAAKIPLKHCANLTFKSQLVRSCWLDHG